MTTATARKMTSVLDEAQIRVRLPREVKRWLALRALDTDQSVQRIVSDMIFAAYTRDTEVKRSATLRR